MWALVTFIAAPHVWKLTPIRWLQSPIEEKRRGCLMRLAKKSLKLIEFKQHLQTSIVFVGEI